MPAAIQTPRLGSSELEVSRPALGSWRTFESIPREDGLAVMLAAREQGLNFLFWPEQSAVAELEGSLARMGFDYVDLIYANPPPEGLPVAEMVGAMDELVASGRARDWGIVNWEAVPVAEAARMAQIDPAALERVVAL